ncbi:protein SHQ1 homolog [Amyelois transitella]|uniref:protein SHQ1 homolog n=1 Tax=Amyelois transitella TaxID=680683 RepID=UPI00067E4A40|nr:protein SHQ1 homolog [Amyelois transitella]
MLTPRFKLTQDDNNVYISVHAPYTNIGDTEIDVDGENFLFVSSPYFLRLHLPGRILDNDRSKGSYVCDSGDFNLTFVKETPGEYFENLDMITSLLAPRDIPDINPSLVEMLEEDGITFDENENHESTDSFGYGFANKLTTQFHGIGNEFPQIFELRMPEQVSVDERNKLRKEYEDNKFSSDHYLADFFDDELISPYVSSEPFWDSSGFNVESDFSEDEVGVLKELPNKNFLLNNKEYNQVLFGLVDILYGYCYDKRTTLNDSTVESSWTINKLSSTLSWFCVFNDVRETLVACYRRALIYPIFRNFELCNKVKNDLVSLFRKGKKFIIKSLIEIHQMFNSSNDARYILNQLYIKDYLIFLQKCRSDELDELCNNIANLEIAKNDLDLELEELESAAEMVQQDEIEIMENKMALKMASMSLLPKRNNAYVEESHETSDSSRSSDCSDSSSDTSSDSSCEDDSSDELDSDDDPL